MNVYGMVLCEVRLRWRSLLGRVVQSMESRVGAVLSKILNNIKKIT